MAESSRTASSMEPEPGRSVPLSPEGSTPQSSAGARRALFARRRFDASASASSGGSRSPSARHPRSPRREPSPPRSPSPGGRPSPAAPSSPGCHVSTSALRPVSPVRGLSPVTVQSSGPPGSLADAFAPSQARLHPGDPSSHARAVSRFSICIIFSTYYLTRPLFWSSSKSATALFFAVCIINAGHAAAFLQTAVFPHL